MAQWIWTGKGRNGESKSGVIDAQSEQDARAQLKQQNINLESIKKKGFELKLPGPLGGSVKSSELVIFVRQFSTMIDAGLPLVQCLDILSSQEPNKYFKKVLLEIKTSVEGGSTFADSLRKFPKVFDNLFVNLVQAGELGGILDTILARLAIYIERNVKVVRQVKSAMTYPIGIMVIAVGMTIAMLKWVIPTFATMFADTGSGLPALTMYVIMASAWMQEYFPYVIAILVVLIVGGIKFYTSEWGRRKFDAFMYRAPIIGNVMQKNAVARFTRTLGTMISSGVPLLDSLEVVGASAGNYVIDDAIKFVRERVKEGSNIAEPLAKTGVFPGMVVQMVSVGESTGAMDAMLQKIADFYEEEAELAIASMTKMMEPLMMVFIGGIVGTVLISMYLPIFTMADAVKG